MGTGTYEDTSGIRRGMFMTRDASSWSTAQRVRVPTGDTASYSVMAGVVCYAVDECLSTGQVPQASSEPFIASYDDGTWQSGFISPPAGAIQQVDSNTTMTFGGLNCQSNGSCEMTGAAYRTLPGDDTNDGFQSYEAVGLHGSGTSWTASWLPFPSDAVIGFGSTSSTVGSMSCTAAGQCVAVGYYMQDSADARCNPWPACPNARAVPLIWTGSGGSWSYQVAPQPAGATAFFGRVDCSDQGLCVATGAYTFPNSGPTEAVLWTSHDSGASWSVQYAPVPSGPLSAGSTLTPDICEYDGCIVGGGYGWASDDTPNPRSSNSLEVHGKPMAYLVCPPVPLAISQLWPAAAPSSTAPATSPTSIRRPTKPGAPSCTGGPRTGITPPVRPFPTARSSAPSRTPSAAIPTAAASPPAAVTRVRKNTGWSCTRCGPASRSRSHFPTPGRGGTLARHRRHHHRRRHRNRPPEGRQFTQLIFETSAPLRLTPSDAFNLVKGPPNPVPFSLGPEQSRTYTYQLSRQARYRSMRTRDRRQGPQRPFGYGLRCRHCHSRRPSQGRGHLLPQKIKIPADKKGDDIPQAFSVRVKVTNTVGKTLQNVKLEKIPVLEKMGAGMALPMEQNLKKKQPSLDLGTLAAKQSVSRTFPFLADTDGQGRVTWVCTLRGTRTTPKTPSAATAPRS